MTPLNLALDRTRDNLPSAAIRSCPRPVCFLCGSAGVPLYHGLPDRLFGAPGTWNLKRCPNSACGLLWLDPMPLEEDIGKAYLNYFTHAAPESGQSPPPGLYRRAVRLVKSAYVASRFGYGAAAGRPLRWLLALPVYLSPLHRPELDFPLTYLTREKIGRLLEIGCGAGDWLRIAENLGWRAEGVDFDPAAVANARKGGLSVHVGQLAGQNFCDRTFDLIFMSHVIEHVHDPIQLLRECRRVLSDRGLLVVWTPNSDSWGHARFASNWTGLHPPQHLCLLNPRTLGAIARFAGFADVKIFTTIRTAAAYFVTARSFKRHGIAKIPDIQERLYGYGCALAERLMLIGSPFIGEELITEIRK